MPDFRAMTHPFRKHLHVPTGRFAKYDQEPLWA
jgi:hypothetical protein